MLKEITPERSANEDNNQFLPDNDMRMQSMSELIPGFLDYCKYDQQFSPQTVAKYEESLNWIVRLLGDMPVTNLKLAEFTVLKGKILERNAKEARVASIIFAARSFLKYCKEILEMDVLDYKKLKAPRQKRREVVFLSKEEINQFVESIKLENEWQGHTKRKCVRIDGLRFRTLVEILLGTGMRVSEALALDRDSIDFKKKEAKIIGKGSKERTVFFTDRALRWINYYLENRDDDAKPLLVTKNLTRLHRNDVNKLFQQYTKKSGLKKKVTPHILRHTVATNLLFNGCPINHVKEILGHELLETTCKYYLGIDKRAAKDAHAKHSGF